jgi:fumarylpyruvate hydrolase
LSKKNQTMSFVADPPMMPSVAGVIGHIGSGSIKVTVNNRVRQDADTADLIWSVPEIGSILSQTVRNAPGDLVYTGMPAGVDALAPCDLCVVEIEGLSSISTPIERQSPQ